MISPFMGLCRLVASGPRLLPSDFGDSGRFLGLVRWVRDAGLVGACCLWLWPAGRLLLLWDTEDRRRSRCARVVDPLPYEQRPAAPPSPPLLVLPGPTALRGGARGSPPPPRALVVADRGAAGEVREGEGYPLLLW